MAGYWPSSFFARFMTITTQKKNKANIQLYFINTNEIPSELSCKNMISSHAKKTCYNHM